MICWVIQKKKKSEILCEVYIKTESSQRTGRTFLKISLMLLIIRSKMTERWEKEMQSKIDLLNAAGDQEVVS